MHIIHHTAVKKNSRHRAEMAMVVVTRMSDGFESPYPYLSLVDGSPFSPKHKIKLFAFYRNIQRAASHLFLMLATKYVTINTEHITIMLPLISDVRNFVNHGNQAKNPIYTAGNGNYGTVIS